MQGARHEGHRLHQPGHGRRQYADSLPLFGGLSIWDANPKIVEALKLAGTLMHVEKHKHSYMHCWRHKTPIIYRATSQWFAGMDAAPDGGPTLRANRRWPASTPRPFIRPGAAPCTP